MFSGLGDLCGKEQVGDADNGVGLTLTDGGGADMDTLYYRGTDASDTFTVPSVVIAAPSISQPIAPISAQVGVG